MRKSIYLLLVLIVAGCGDHGTSPPSVIEPSGFYTGTYKFTECYQTDSARVMTGYAWFQFDGNDYQARSGGTPDGPCWYFDGGGSYVRHGNRITFTDTTIRLMLCGGHVITGNYTIVQDGNHLRLTGIGEGGTLYQEIVLTYEAVNFVPSD